MFTMDANPEITPGSETPADPKDPKDLKKGGTDGGDSGETPKTFTQEELDKVVSTRLTKEQEKLDKKLSDTLKKERENWEKQSKLSEDERAKEMEKAKEAEYTERESRIKKGENRIKGAEEFITRGLPKELLDYVVDEDDTKMMDSIEAIDKIFKSAVKSGVAEALKGEPPVDPNIPSKPKVEDGATKKPQSYF